MKFAFYILFILLLTFQFSQAQNVSGKWYGVGKVEAVNGGSNSYMSELQLEQKGKYVSGILNYYFRDSLFSNAITGTFDAENRTLILHSTNIIFHKSSNTNNGVDCEMSGRFILRIAKAESVLTGILFANKNFKYTCPDINFKLKKETFTEAIDPTIPITKNEVEKKDTIIATTVAALPKVVTPISIFPLEKEKSEAFVKREKVYTKEFDILEKEIRLEFYDNGAVDGDSISVFLNNKLVLPASRLENTPLVLNITYDDNLPFNELSMFAESLGTIPPNTAVLVIYDGKKRYEVLMSSDFNKSSTIKLNRRKYL